MTHPETSGARGPRAENNMFYIPGTQITSIFEGQPSQNKAQTPIKTRVILGSRLLYQFYGIRKANCPRGEVRCPRVSLIFPIDFPQKNRRNSQLPPLFLRDLLPFPKGFSDGFDANGIQVTKKKYSDPNGGGFSW